MFRKFKFRSQEFTRWVIFAIMLFTVFGFASRSIFRLFRAEGRNTNVSYDSNLHDKSGNSENSRLPKIDVDFKNISTELELAENLIKAGEDKNSLSLLKNSESIAFAHASDEGDPFHIQFETIGNEIISLKKNLKEGNRKDVIQRIETLIKRIKTSS